eukprot:TRINITY_DN5572_c0_g1_i1.p1 TRINITY_DN5572_c0_g1~~TRINITY_DN5572_c0_g1_i1.p1  ORF type:complete len:393 (-),score=54.45 TRINITY_DN5572_c0_g1_i1:374-1552(-)
MQNLMEEAHSSTPQSFTEALLGTPASDLQDYYSSLEWIMLNHQQQVYAYNNTLPPSLPNTTLAIPPQMHHFGYPPFPSCPPIIPSTTSSHFHFDLPAYQVRPSPYLLKQEQSPPSSPHSNFSGSTASNPGSGPASPVGSPLHHPHSHGHSMVPAAPLTQKRETSIPEFIHSPHATDTLQIGSDTVTWQLQEPLHRNYYHSIQFKVPSAVFATSPSSIGSSYEGYRVYIHPNLGYSGNAKRFKQGPEPGEKAFMLEGVVLDQQFRTIQQCGACTEYFENKSYFVANPHCKGRILLIKNNSVTRIKGGSFSLNMKPMCCTRHHQSPFYFYFLLRDCVNNKVVMTSLFVCHVKQWKKTSAPAAASGAPAKRRKLNPLPPNTTSLTQPSTIQLENL